MRALIKLLFLLLLLSVLTISAVAFLALDDSPLVDTRSTLSHLDIARAKTILKQSDPRGVPPGTRRTIELTAQDLNLAASYLLQKSGNGSARVSLDTDRLTLDATLRVPGLRWRNFVNLQTTVTAEHGRPALERLSLGSLPIPGPVATAAGRWWLTRTLGPTRGDSSEDLVQALRLSPDRLQLTYRWNPAMIEQARNTLLGAHDREALKFYLDLLVDLQDQGIGTRGSLTGLLRPMFEAASKRSHERSPVAENAAMLTVLGTWAGRQNVNRLVPDSTRRPQGYRLKLQGRIDFGQHFLISAALAAHGDRTLSDAVGLFKEISDTDQGSGFSFTDIAADRTGTRFGEIATRSPAGARALQHRVAAGVTETEIMPAARDLPEHLDAAAFNRRYGAVGSPAYQAVIDEIDRRIAALALYRD